MGQYILVDLPDDVSKDAQLANAVDELGFGPRPDHVVLRHGRVDPVHQDEGVSLLGVLGARAYSEEGWTYRQGDKVYFS